jgi:hypothetical protein
MLSNKASPSLTVIALGKRLPGVVAGVFGVVRWIESPMSTGIAGR